MSASNQSPSHRGVDGEEHAAHRESECVRVGDWVVLPARTECEAYELSSGTSVRLRGELTKILTENGSSRRTLRALGRIDEAAKRLNENLDAETPEPLTYASLLRGSGWGQLFLELTGRCNEKCVHCYADSGPTREEHLTVEQVRRVVAEARQLGLRWIQFTGGDPLISPALLPGVERAREVGFEKVEVYTNGLALQKELCNALAAHQVDFAFSFYSHRPEIHDQITQTPGSQVRTLRAIERALDSGSQVRVNVIVMDANANDFDGAQALLERMGVQRIGGDQERQVGRGHFSNALEHPLLRKSSTEENLQPAHGRSKADAGDGRARGKLCVTYDGAVVPCIFMRSHRLGWIQERALGEILSQPIARRSDAQLKLALARERLACHDCSIRDQLLERCQPNPPRP